MSIWDDIKDLFTKIEYDKEEAKQKENELNDWLAKQNEKEANKIKDMYDDGYKNGLPKEPDIEYKEGVFEDDSTIENKAKEEYDGLWNSDKEALEDKYDSSKENLAKEGEDYAKSTKEKMEAIERENEINKDKAQNKAIKNGLVNSSIITETKEGLDDIKEKSILGSTQKLQDKISEIDKEIETLSVEKELKKNRLDSDYRKKIESKINSLKTDRQKEMDKLDKYNNEMAQKEKKYAEDVKKYGKEYEDKWRQEEKSREEYYRQNGYVGEKQKDYDNRLEAVYSFYKQLPKKDAKEMIENNPSLRKYLGNNYTKLIMDINK